MPDKVGSARISRGGVWMPRSWGVAFLASVAVWALLALFTADALGRHI
jgi:hypothetical protein